MPRRNRELNVILAVGQLAALAVLVAMVSPQFRDKVQDLGRIAGVLFAVAAVGLLCGFVVLVRLKRSRHRRRNDSGKSNQPVDSAPSDSAPLHLRDQIRALDWYQFEKLVELVYRREGYMVTRRGGARADGGIDLILERDSIRTAVQCKHWQKWKVGVRTVREFLGAMTAEKMESGILVAFSGYTDDASAFAKGHDIELVAGDGLISLLESGGLQTEPQFLQLLNDKRKLCPKCESEMVLRESKKGASAGGQFWGCSAFPKCRFTFPVE